MRHSIAATAACFVVLLAASAVASAADATPPPGCKESLKEVAALEASLKRDIKVPYEPKTNKLKSCFITQPQVSLAVKQTGKASVAIVVFDVTASGRVADQELIGKKTPWAEVAQNEVSQWVFEPLVEGDVGITRVGVTAVFIAEFQGAGQSCGKLKPPVEGDFIIRVCASR